MVSACTASNVYIHFHLPFHSTLKAINSRPYARIYVTAIIALRILGCEQRLYVSGAIGYGMRTRSCMKASIVLDHLHLRCHLLYMRKDREKAHHESFEKGRYCL